MKPPLGPGGRAFSKIGGGVVCGLESRGDSFGRAFLGVPRHLLFSSGISGVSGGRVASGEISKYSSMTESFSLS